MMMPGPSKESHEISSLEAGNSIVILMCLCHICTNKVDTNELIHFRLSFRVVFPRRQIPVFWAM